MVSKETLGLLESMKGLIIAFMGFTLIILGFYSGDASATTGFTASGVALIGIYYGKHTQSSIVDQLMAVIRETQTAATTPAVTHVFNDVQAGTAPSIEDLIKVINDPIVQQTLADVKEVTPEIVKPIVDDIQKARQ